MLSTEPLRQLKPGRGRDGRALAGLWQCDSVRMERDGNGWLAEVPMRQIGATPYYEFRAIERGGMWHPLGHFRTRRLACDAATLLLSGTHVWRPPHTTETGAVPGMHHEWSRVVDEIAAHPSVSGQQPCAGRGLRPCTHGAGLSSTPSESTTTKRLQPQQ